MLEILVHGKMPLKLDKSLKYSWIVTREFYLGKQNIVHVHHTTLCDYYTAFN